MPVSPSGKIRVLVVDDSTSMRLLIRTLLTADPAIEVVGVAADGVEAVEQTISLKPDVITMDVEMPRMNGIAAVKQIMASSPTRVIMLSSLTHEGAKTTFEALDAGAIDFVAKTPGTAFGEELKSKVKAAVRPAVSRNPAPPATTPSTGSPLTLKGRKISVVGIGASTGGPNAVMDLVSRLPANFPFGIAIAIHMPKAFTGVYAERLNSKCALSVREAADGDLLKPGTILVAPGGMHSALVRQPGGIAFKISPTSDYPQHVYIPSVDIMLTSLAEAVNGAMLGVVLTGMGNDGFKGMQTLKQKGGVTLVQDAATCTVYGMPKACVDGKVADFVLPISQIGIEIAKMA